MSMHISLRKLLVICLITGGVAALGALYVSSKNAAPQPAEKKSVSKSSKNIPSTTEPLFIGASSAPITIVEYVDFKCPKCNAYQQDAGQKIRREYVDTGKAKIVLRPYPVFGEDAGLALYGAYCAASQNKFPAYYDAVFAHMSTLYKDGDYSAAAQKVLTKPALVGIAQGAGIEGSLFGACLDGTTHKRAFEAAQHAAARDSVQGTPTIVIGGEKIVGNQPYQIYKTLLELSAHEP